VGMKCKFEWSESGLLHSLSEHTRKMLVDLYSPCRRTQLSLNEIALAFVINEFRGKTYVLTHYT
jgi:hypothetical protein